MHRRHNSGMQVLVCAVYITFTHSLKRYDLYMLAGSALSHNPADNQHLNSMHIMYVDSYVMEDTSESHAAGG